MNYESKESLMVYDGLCAEMCPPREPMSCVSSAGCVTTNSSLDPESGHHLARGGTCLIENRRTRWRWSPALDFIRLVKEAQRSGVPAFLNRLGVPGTGFSSPRPDVSFRLVSSGGCLRDAWCLTERKKDAIGATCLVFLPQQISWASLEADIGLQMLGGAGFGRQTSRSARTGSNENLKQ